MRYSFHLSGMFPARRRSRLGPTRYVPRCKCGAPLDRRGDYQQHIGPCESCHAKMLAFLRLVAQ